MKPTIKISTKGKTNRVKPGGPTEPHPIQLEIAKMAIKFQLKIFPLNGKIPYVKDWQKVASFDPHRIDLWIEKFGHKKDFGWGWPQTWSFVLDQDGPHKGKIKKEWLEGPYCQKTKKGFHIFRKNPGWVRNANRFQGDFDLRGNGGYVRLYDVIFTDKTPPEKMPEPHKGLLALIKGPKTPLNGAKPAQKEREIWAEGTRNDSLYKASFNDFVATGGKNILSIQAKALRSGLIERDIEKTIASAQKKAEEKKKDEPPFSSYEQEGKSRKEPGPQKTPAPMFRKLKAPIEPLDYLDDKNTFLKGKLIVVGGDKASLKSTGVLSLLLETDKKILYYSSGEVSEGQARKVARAKEKENNLLWLEHSPTKPAEWKNLTEQVKNEGIEACFFDPPELSGSTNSDSDVKSLLRPYRDLAVATGASVIITRNLNKNELIKKSENRLSGSYMWRAFPRQVFFLNKCEIGSKHRETPDKPPTSIFSCLDCNEGKKPKHAYIFTLKTDKKDDKKITTLPYVSCLFVTPEGPLEALYKNQNDPVSAEKKATREHFILGIINEHKNGINKGVLKNKVIEDRKISLSSVKKDIQSLYKKDLIEGIGTGPNSAENLYKITKAGEKVLEQD